MIYSNKDIFSHIKQLKQQSKFKDALKSLDEFKDTERLNLNEQFEFHYLKSILLSELGNYGEALKYNNLALKKSKQLKDNLRIFDVLIKRVFLIGIQYGRERSFKVLVKAEKVLNTINQKMSTQFKDKRAKIEFEKARYYYNIGDYKGSLDLARKSLFIAKEDNDRESMMLITKLIAFNYSMKGEIDIWLKYIKKHLSLAEELNDKQEIIGALNSLGMIMMEKGNFLQGIEYAKRGLSICDEIGSWKTAAVLSTLFELNVFVHNLKESQQCLDRLKLILDQEYIKWYDEWYRCGKAILLKNAPYEQDHVKALALFKQIANEDNVDLGVRYDTLINICDLYLRELNNKNDLKVIDEIQPYIKQLENLSKTYKKYWIQVELHSLKAKLNLIMFNFEEAQRLLVIAHNIAERHDLTRLIKQILLEQTLLSNNLLRWEKLKISNARMSERMNLARIEEQIVLLLQKRKYLQWIKS